MVELFRRHSNALLFVINNFQQESNVKKLTNILDLVCLHNMTRACLDYESNMFLFT